MSKVDTFFPAEELSHLLEGSYEAAIARVSEIVQENTAKIFGSSTSATVLATFSGYAIVLSEQGDLRRVRYQDSGEILESVEVPFKPLRGVGVTDYVDRQLDQAVRAFCRGDSDGALSLIETIVPLVGAEVANTDARDLLSRFARPRFWKKLLDENRTSIVEDLSKHLTDSAARVLSEGRLSKKFSRLYDGTVSIVEAERYREAVTSGLKDLQAATKSLSEMIELASTRIPTEDRLLEGDAQMIEHLCTFKKDLVDDIALLSKTLSTDIRLLRDVGELGRIYDVLAESLYDYQLAGCFVERAYNGISAS